MSKQRLISVSSILGYLIIALYASVIYAVDHPLVVVMILLAVSACVAHALRRCDHG